MVKIICQRCVVSVCLLVVTTVVVIGQDSSVLIEVARANGESMRNFDVSYKQSTIVNLPKDPELLKEIQQSYGQAKTILWDETIEMGRLVIDKQKSGDAKRLLFIRSVDYLKSGKVEQRHSEFVVWIDGNSVSGTTRNSSGETARARISLEQLYRHYSPPSFETFFGSLSPPQTEGYWEDHSQYWDFYKSGISGFKFERSPAGGLKLTNETSQYVYVTTYDPLSLLMISYSRSPAIGIGENGSSKAEAYGDITWENRENVYILKSIIAHDKLLNCTQDVVTSFYWHQLNNESFVFPTHIFDKASFASCTSFLIDGQSEISAVKFDGE